VLLTQRRQGFDHLDGLHAYRDDLGEEADDVFGVVGAVRVGADAAVLVFRHLVPVNHPLEGATIAKAVFERFGRYAVQRERIVHLE